MKDLIDKLEKASGPDRELDALIHVALNPGQRVMLDHGDMRARRKATYGVLADFPLDGWSDWEGVCMHIGAPDYTGSIDAAMVMVPEGMELWLTNMYGDARAVVGLNTESGGERGEHKGGSLAIALCIAALKARGGQSA